MFANERKVRDSNPGCLSTHALSRGAHSAALSTFRTGPERFELSTYRLGGGRSSTELRAVVGRHRMDSPHDSYTHVSLRGTYNLGSVTLTNARPAGARAVPPKRRGEAIPTVEATGIEPVSSMF